MMKKFALLIFIFSSPLFGTTDYKVHLSSAWYPEKKAHLLEALMHYNEYASHYYSADLDPFKVRAIVVPHAGLQYSGSVATAAYRLLPHNFFKRIIVLAPSHHAFFKGVGLPHADYDSYKNVLGHIPLDKVALNGLIKNNTLFSYAARAHELDHSISMQIPFIQYYCGARCELLPLLVGDVTVEQAQNIAKILRDYIDDKTLVVVSSDFTHYGRKFSYEPFKGEGAVVTRIGELDASIVAGIEKGDLYGFDKILKETGVTVCGKNPLKVLLAMMQQGVFHATDTYVVGYDTSDSAVENPDHSVSYVSCVISHELKRKDSSDYLTGLEKGLLLSFARNELERVVEDKKNVIKKNTFIPGFLTQSLREMSGAFVTLYKIGNNGYKKLRGCIGTIIGAKPLYEGVIDMTRQAALFDSRFKPVRNEELPYIDISISVLSHPKQIVSYRDIMLGRDGVILTHHEYSAVYLPKVATEQHWNVAQLLQSLSQKAGLSAKAWDAKDTTYQTFTSIDFSEDKDPLEFMYEEYKNDEK